MDAAILLLRFLFGAIMGGILVAVLAIFNLLPPWVGIGLPVAAGVLGVVFGDAFLTRFMRVFRWLS